MRVGADIRKKIYTRQIIYKWQTERETFRVPSCWSRRASCCWENKIKKSFIRYFAFLVILFNSSLIFRKQLLLDEEISVFWILSMCSCRRNQIFSYQHGNIFSAFFLKFNKIFILFTLTNYTTWNLKKKKNRNNFNRNNKKKMKKKRLTGILRKSMDRRHRRCNSSKSAILRFQWSLHM